MVDDVPVFALPQHHSLHPVIQNALGNAAQRLKDLHVATQHTRQVLAEHETAGQKAAIPQHQGKQPRHPNPVRLIGKHRLELRKVHLRLLARGGLEAMLKTRLKRRADRA